MRTRGVLSLLIIASLLGGFYFFYLLPHKKDKALREDLSKKFFSGTPESIEFVKIAHSGNEFIIKNTESGWMILQPLNAKADEKVIKNIARLLDKERLKKIIPLDDLSKSYEFGFEKPGAYLLVGYKGTIEEYMLGNKTPTGSGIYMMKRGVPAVFVIEENIGQVLVNDLYYFRNKDAFDFDPKAVTRILLTRKNESLEMVKKGKGWQIKGEYSGPGSSKDIAEFLNSVRNLRAEQFFDEGAVKPYNLKNLSQAVKIELYTEGSSPRWIIEARFWGTGSHEGIIAWQEGQPYQTRVQRDFWNLMNRAAVAFRYRNLFDFENNAVTEIAVGMSEKPYGLYLRKGRVEKAEGTDIPKSGEIEKGLWYLRSLEASDIIGATRPPDLQDNPRMVVTVKRQGGESQELKVYNKSSAEHGFTASGQGVKAYYAWAGNLNVWCLLMDEDIEKLEKGFWK